VVFLGVRKRKINEISQVNALIKAKLESKSAKTTCLLTAALILSFLPAIRMVILEHISSVFETNSFSRLGEALMHMNSLVSPILYCYRDRQFRKVVLELLGMREPNAVEPGDGAARFVRRDEPFGSVGQLEKSFGYKNSRELLSRPSNSNKNSRHQLSMQPRMARLASCYGVIFVDCVHRLAKPHEIFLRRKSSASI